MFEIEALKEKKLVELQEIAKTIGVKKISQLKKADLVYQILDVQASKPVKQEPKPRTIRKRIQKPSQPSVKKENNTTSQKSETPEETPKEEVIKTEQKPISKPEPRNPVSRPQKENVTAEKQQQNTPNKRPQRKEHNQNGSNQKNTNKHNKPQVNHNRRQGKYRDPDPPARRRRHHSSPQLLPGQFR
jgi:transcription termination factor Rho